MIVSPLLVRNNRYILIFEKNIYQNAGMEFCFAHNISKIIILNFEFFFTLFNKIVT